MKSARRRVTQASGLPFKAQKWDVDKESKAKRRLSVQLKIAVGIAVVMAALIAAVVLICVLGKGGSERDFWLPTYESASKLGVFERAAVSTDSAVCAPIGREMLEKNGSAVDAAIATLLCMGAVAPQSMGLGGGFLMLIYERSSGMAHYLDAREMAPLRATEDMFQKNGTSSEVGSLAIAVPGELAGYYTAHKRFGLLSWKELFQPAIKMCREGITVTGHLARHLKSYASKIKERPAFRNIFVNNETGEVYEEGDVIFRPDLAATLEAIAEDGKSALYDPSHPLASKFLEDLKDIGSIIEAEDMAQYEARWLKPLTSNLRNNLTLHSTGVPGSGELLTFMLNILDGYNISRADGASKTNAVLYLHRELEAFKFAYAKRRYLEDDPDGIKELTRNLTSREYADAVRSLISDSATHNDLEFYGYENHSFSEDHGTAHVSIVAPNGDAVSVTSTVNVYFGSLEMSPSTGIIMNDEMDDFSSPNIISYHDVPPSPYNRIRPKRRPMSSMCPTIVVGPDGSAILVLGGNGGTKITTAVLQVLARNLWFGEDIKTAIDGPRFHHQLLPNKIDYESKFPKDLLEELEKKGHRLHKHDKGMLGIIMGVARGTDGRLYANSDYRKEGDVDGF